MKLFALVAAILALGCTLASNATPPSEGRGAWQTYTYPKIGLKIDLPPWKLDVSDQDSSWSLLAFPLVENPASDVQYRVMVSAIKLTEKQYVRFYRDTSHKLSGWENSEHLQTSQMTNEFWIYTRRDVVGSNGFAYNFSGRVKRIVAANPGAVQQPADSEEKLATDVRRILDSIEVLSTNTLSRLLPNSVQLSSNGVTASNVDKQPKDLHQLFNAMTPAEIERVKSAFAQLRPRMTPEECFGVLGIDRKRTYPASSWGPPEKQCVSLMLGQEHVLLLVWDARSDPARLLTAQLDEMKWPEKRTGQKE